MGGGAARAIERGPKKVAGPKNKASTQAKLPAVAGGGRGYLGAGAEGGNIGGLGLRPAPCVRFCASEAQNGLLLADESAKRLAHEAREAQTRWHQMRQSAQSAGGRHGLWPGLNTRSLIFIGLSVAPPSRMGWRGNPENLWPLQTCHRRPTPQPRPAACCSAQRRWAARAATGTAPCGSWCLQCAAWC